MSYSLIELRSESKAYAVRNPKSYGFCVTLYPAALFFHTQLSLVASWLHRQLFQDKLCSFSQQTLWTNGFTSSALIQGTFLFWLLWLRHFYPRRRCPSCNWHFSPRGKVSIIKSLSSPLRALLRWECKVFNLVSDKSRNEGSLTVKEHVMLVAWTDL